MSNKKTIVYIASLPHSGSTVLDYMLSFHPDVVGLGEVYSVLNDKVVNHEKTNDICSCGAKLNQCPVWKAYKERNISPQKTTYEQRYMRLLESVSLQKYKVILESSKDIKHLCPLVSLAQGGEIDLKVIFMLRDVRGWTRSMMDLDRERKRRARIPLRYFNIWYKKTKEMQKYLKEQNIDHMQISYRQFCFETDTMLKKIWRFIDIDPELCKQDSKPNSHIAYGNRAKKNTKKIIDIRYDSRGIAEYGINAMLLLMPWVHKFNNNELYKDAEEFKKN